ncbi:MAG: LuxR C-terminal-related transcriptional regulator [Pseudomonadales bacterium]|nr:LuxR C-terminal-related transcriptional regulator [Pseudomonadales bacterium]
MTENTSNFMGHIKRLLPALTLAGAALFFAYDILVDLLTGIDSKLHITLEFIVFLAISAVLGAELLHINRLNRVIDSERSKSARLAGEMIQVMHSQFNKWGLSTSEAEVALLLIKGLSMKEIAEVRQVKEKTVRTQSASIYAKSAQAERHELAAFFIEDLMSNISTPAADNAGLNQ